jgi:hypothetical protein
MMMIVNTCKGMVGVCNELSGKCGSCQRKFKEGVMCDDCDWWFNWECANNTDSDVDADKKPWYCMVCKQVRKCKEQEETILSLRRKLALVHNEITLLKAVNSSSCSCNGNCLCSPWTDVKAKTRPRIKSLCSIKDQNVNVKLTNKLEPLAVLEPETVVQFKKCEYPKPSNKKCKKVLLLGSSHGRGLSDHLHSVPRSE